jgi:hypothetical protein
MKFANLIVSVAFALFSCQYENNDIYVNPINPPTNAGASVNLNNVSEPIVINSPTWFNFSTTPSGKELYQATVKVNGTQLFSLSSTTGEFSFVLDPSVTGNGNKELTIDVRYASLSPSLAGQLGIESLVVSNNWDVTIDTTPPSRLASPQVYLEDGKSMVKWNTPDRFTFTELIVIRSYLSANGNVVARDSIKIEDRNTTLIHESSYVGGPVTYRVDLKGYKYYVPGSETSFNVTPLRFTLDSLSTIQKLSYDISPLYNNDIAIVVDGISRPPDESVTYSYDGIFGTLTELEFRVVATHPPPSFFAPHRYTIRVAVYKGIKIPSFEDIEYIPSENIYLLSTSTAILRLDGNTYEVTGTYLYPNHIGRNLLASANGEYVYIYGVDKLYPLDYKSPNLSVGTPINLTTITGVWNQGLIYEPEISTNNIITFSLAATSKVFAADLNTSQIVWQATGFGRPIISDDAAYIYFKGSVYKNENNSWGTFIGTVSQANNELNAYFKQVAGVAKVAVATFGPGDVYIYNPSIPVANSILNPESNIPYYYQYDKHSQQYLALVNASSSLANGFIYDSETLEQTNSLQWIVLYSGTARLCNGHIFHSNGYIWPRI